MTTWENYIKWEKLHSEDPLDSSEFLRRIWVEVGEPVLGHHFNDVLEIGIGQSGGVLQFIQAERKVSVDPLFGTEKIKAEEMSYRNEFDLVIITNALTHCENMGQVVKNIRKSLRLGGHVFFMNFLHENEPHPHHFCYLEQIIKLFRHFKIISKLEVPRTTRNEFVVINFERV